MQHTTVKQLVVNSNYNLLTQITTLTWFKLHFDHKIHLPDYSLWQTKGASLINKTKCQEGLNIHHNQQWPKANFIK